MGVSVGTIFKWYNPDKEGEYCEDGQCVGIVTKTGKSDDERGSDMPHVMVKWWEMCRFHRETCPDETGPYKLEWIWQIGQFY